MNVDEEEDRCEDDRSSSNSDKAEIPAEEGQAGGVQLPLVKMSSKSPRSRRGSVCGGGGGDVDQNSVKNCNLIVNNNDSICDGHDGDDKRPNDDGIKRSPAAKPKKGALSAIPPHLKVPSNQSLQRSISADMGAFVRPRRDSRLLNRRQSHYEFDPRKLVEAKRQAGFWKDDSWNPLVHLKFRDVDDEKAFCKMYREKGRRILKMWSLVFLVLSCATIIWRPSFDMFSFQLVWIVASVLQLAFNFFYVVVIYTMLWSQMRIQLITMFVLCVNSVIMSLYAAILGRFPDSALSLILIGYASIRLRLSYSLITGLVTTIACNLFYTFIAREPASTLLFLNVHLIACNLIGAVTGYFLERRERMHFFDLYTYYEDCSLVEFEKDKIDFLLKAAIPAKFIQQLPFSNPAEKFNSVSVAFICLDNVIEYTDSRNSEESIRVLNELFRVCEARTQQFGCEKIKTIQDKYMVMCGAPEAHPDHAIILADMVLSVVQDFQDIQDTPEFKHKYPGLRLCVRVGMSSGPIVAGVIGVKRFCWDIWGDTVNVASRMEDPKNGLKNRSAEIRISSATEELLKDSHVCTPASTIYVKGKGDMQTFLLEKRKKSRLSQRRPSEPRENQLPEYRAFSWENVQESTPSEAPLLKSDSKFKDLHFQKMLPSTRFVLLFVVLVYSLFGVMYNFLPIAVPRVVFISRYAVVLPFWLLHFLVTFSPRYTLEVSALFKCLSLMTMIVCTTICQLVINRKLHSTDSASAVLDSSLSQLNWISFLSYFFFGISLLHNYVLVTLLVGVISGACIWIVSGVFMAFHDIPWIIVHFLIFTFLSSFWVSYELNGITVKTWQVACGIEERRSELKKKKQVVDEILKNIIPSPYLSYVSSQHDVNIDVRGMHKSHPNVAVLSSDVSNFTMITEKMDPITLVSSLHELFSRFDALTVKYTLEKVKTVGDAYVACSGLFSESGLKSRAGDVDLRSAMKVRNAVEMALDMQEEVAAYNRSHPDRTPIAIRVGVHCGHVFSGIVGHSKFQFDVFGHTVSVTDSLERGGKVWAVHVSQEVKDQLDKLWLHHTSGDLVIDEWNGYSYRTLSGKSYLLQRRRWLGVNGEIQVGRSEQVGAKSVASISTLSILSHFVESKGEPQCKRTSSNRSTIASSLRNLQAAQALKLTRQAQSSPPVQVKPIERHLGKSFSDNRIG